MKKLLLSIGCILQSTFAADVVFAPQLDEYYGTKVDVKCSIDRGMEITLVAPLAAGNMRFMLAADPKCKLKKNGNYHTIQTRLSGCNNEIFMDSTTLTIANTIVNVMSFGRNPIKIESPVGCLFHSQEVSVGALMEEEIPLEIAPTMRPTMRPTNDPTDIEDDNYRPNGVDNAKPKPNVPGSEPPMTGDSSSEPSDVSSDKPDSAGDPDAPSARDGIPDSIPESGGSNDPSQPGESLDANPNITNENVPPTVPDNTTDKDDNSDPSDKTSDSNQQSNDNISPENPPNDSLPNKSPDDSASSEDPGTDYDSPDIQQGNDRSVPQGGDSDDYDEDEDGIEREKETVKVNIVTTERTGPNTTRLTTTPLPTTIETATGIILVDNGGEFEDEPDEDENSPQDETEIGESNVETSEQNPETSDPIVPEGEGEGVNDELPIMDDDEDPDSGMLIPKRSCFPFCDVPRKKKKKDKKETLWRVVARGDGLFFARMHLFTDETFSKAWMYPPSLKTNETIYAGVVLANGPAEATISLTSCWASNMRHEIINLKQPELQKDEITLPLINDGCAVTYPPDLVSMVENGQSSAAKFTSSVFQFVGYDTAYLYCRVRVCPLGPCPQKCDDSDPDYEYYDIDVGLGIHSDAQTENDFESSGEEIFDMPKFEMLIADEPENTRQVNDRFDPYRKNDGPLVAATLYRKFEFSQEISTEDTRTVTTTAERKPKHFLENQSIVQAVLLGLLGAACVTLVLLSVFVIKKRSQEKRIE